MALMQAKVIAKVLANKLALPSEEAMLADISAFYEDLASHGQPIRYAHNQGYPMPEELKQFAYNDSLSEWASLSKHPEWRRQLSNYVQKFIFGRPETFRDSWTNEETAAMLGAERACHLMWEDCLQLQGKTRGSVRASGKNATVVCRL